MATRKRKAVRPRRGTGKTPRARKPTIAEQLEAFAHADALGTGAGSISYYLPHDRKGDIEAARAFTDEDAARLASDLNNSPTEKKMIEDTPTAAAPDELLRLEQAARPEPVAGESAAPSAPVPKSGDILAGMLQPVFMVLTPNWHITKNEADQLGQSWGAVIDHYYPGGIGELGPWGAAILCTAAVVGPRVAMRVPPRLPPPAPPKPAEPETQTQMAADAPYVDPAQPL